MKKISLRTLAVCAITTSITISTYTIPTAHTVCATTLLSAPLITLGVWWRHKKQRKHGPVTKQTTHQVAFLCVQGPVTDTQQFHTVMKQCMTDPKIKGMILSIDAESGILSICHTMFKELQKFAEKKPLIALIEKGCCREPYLIATAAPHIIANEHSLIGMIGTSACFTELKKETAKETLVFYAGRLTPLGNIHHHMTTTEQQLIAEQLELHYQQLCSTISRQRNLPLANAARWAEGKPFLGSQALTVGLIDHIGTLSDAQELMNSLLEMPRHPLAKIEYLSFSL